MNKIKVLLLFIGLIILIVIGILFINNLLVVMDNGGKLIAVNTFIYIKALISNIATVIKILIVSIIFWLVGITVISAYFKNIIKRLKNGKE